MRLCHTPGKAWSLASTPGNGLLPEAYGNDPARATAAAGHSPACPVPLGLACHWERMTPSGLQVTNGRTGSVEHVRLRARVERIRFYRAGHRMSGCCCDACPLRAPTLGSAAAVATSAGGLRPSTLRLRLSTGCLCLLSTLRTQLASQLCRFMLAFSFARLLNISHVLSLLYVCQTQCFAQCFAAQYHANRSPLRRKKRFQPAYVVDSRGFAMK